MMNYLTQAQADDFSAVQKKPNYTQVIYSHATSTIDVEDDDSDDLSLAPAVIFVEQKMCALSFFKLPTTPSKFIFSRPVINLVYIARGPPGHA